MELIFTHIINKSVGKKIQIASKISTEKKFTLP